MKSCWLTLLAAMSLLAATALSQDRKDGPKAVPPAVGSVAGSDLRFTEDGKDLLVHLTIEGPAARQVVLSEYTIDDGTPPWDEPPIGVEKPRRPPRVALRYLVLVNRDLPGFMEKGLMMVPTPPEVRKQQRQEVVWRLPNYRNWGFRKEDTTFTVEASKFEASSEQLRQALPKIKQTIDAWDERLKGGSKAP
jgi:hypothetical protein